MILLMSVSSHQVKLICILLLAGSNTPPPLPWWLFEKAVVQQAWSESTGRLLSSVARKIISLAVFQERAIAAPHTSAAGADVPCCPRLWLSTVILGSLGEPSPSPWVPRAVRLPWWCQGWLLLCAPTSE